MRVLVKRRGTTICRSSNLERVRHELQLTMDMNPLTEEEQAILNRAFEIVAQPLWMRSDVEFSEKELADYESIPI